MSDNKGLNNQELLQRCRNNEEITNQDIGVMPQSSNTDSSGLTYLSEGTILELNFSHNRNKDNDTDK